ncbi:MAG: FAD-dependent monooxygenase [Proteobacteria bacterium]|nr:FAD-dependent monooxygenase [Pseudomonadota bacterium]
MYDVVIVGGGIVGASLALILGQLQYKTLMIEQNAHFESHDDFQARTLALSYASKRIFSLLGLWDKLSDDAISIENIIVSMKGCYGTSRLKPPEFYESLGYVVGQKNLEQVLYTALKSQPSIEVLLGEQLIEKQPMIDGWELDLSNNTKVFCKLLIAADGSGSQLRETLKIGTDQREYDHYALLTNLKLRHSHAFTAFERFLPNGAIAILPWKENYTTCVWTTTQQEAKTLKECDEDTFLRSCEKQLPSQVGRLQACSLRIIFPLGMKLAKQQASARFLLLGNAAHSLHPIAAQGFNLSLRDIWQFRSQIIKTKEKCDLGDNAFLTKYQKERQADQNRIIFATDKIAKYMSSNILPSALRGAGLTLFDILSPLKNKFTLLGMGLS